MKKKVLVVDDDVAILEVIQIILESNDYEAIVTDDTTTVYEKVAIHAPDLILIDIWMPGRDGRQITKELKSQKSTKNIPVIVISALNDTPRIAREIGADSYLLKPFDINNFLEVVEEYTKNKPSVSLS